MRFLYKLLFVAIAIVSFSSCEDNLDDDNIPAIQAVRNGEFFKSTQMSAVNNSDGTVSIIGVNRLERLELILEDSSAGTYPLGSGAPNEAVYTFNGTDVFSSNEGAGNGQVVLSSNTPPGTLTGTFSFVSYLPNNADSLYMRQGIIFQVPFGENIGGGNTPATGSLSASVDGVNFTPAAVTTVGSGGTVLVNASTSTNAIILSFPESTAVGTYNITAGGPYLASYRDGTAVDPGVSGTLVITSVDTATNTFVGTFEFMTGPPNNFNITGGSFTVSY